MSYGYELSSTNEFLRELRGLQWLKAKKKSKQDELALDRYLIAKSAKVGASLSCPACGTTFTKTKTINVFCKYDCAHFFYRHYSMKKQFRFGIDKGKNAGKLLQMTREELIHLHDDTQAIPIHEMFHCAYCGRMGVKRRAEQVFCANSVKCKERFRLLIRERDQSRKNPSEQLALVPISATL